MAAALELLAADGAEALSMRRIADRVGIRAASIYKHFPNKDALEAAMISVAFERQAAAFEQAGGDLAALSRAYRGFARGHPGRGRRVAVAAGRENAGPAAVRPALRQLPRLQRHRR